jgi:hypothetical protein
MPFDPFHRNFLGMGRHHGERGFHPTLLDGRKKM